MSPMPVATPKSDKHTIKPWVPNIMYRMEGGSSDDVPGNLPNRNTKNAAEQQRRRIRLPSMATTAAAVTEAERFGEESINVCISLSDITRKRAGKVTRRKKMLDVRFFFA